MVDLRELAPALAACVVALVFAVAAFTTSGGRRGKGFAVDDGALYTALLDDDEAKVAEDDDAADGPYVVPSRSRLACRQAAYYVAGAWNAVAGAWFARRGTLDAAAAAPLVVALAWLLVSACVEIKYSNRLQCARMRPFRRKSFGRASRTRREQSIHPKISRIDFDLTEIESSEVWSGPPKPVVDFHTGAGRVGRRRLQRPGLGRGRHDRLRLPRARDEGAALCGIRPPV